MINPEGVLVGYGTFAELAKKLPPISAATAWAACRDGNDNYAIGNDADNPMTPGHSPSRSLGGHIARSNSTRAQ